MSLQGKRGKRCGERQWSVAASVVARTGADVVALVDVRKLGVAGRCYAVFRVEASEAVECGVVDRTGRVLQPKRIDQPNVWVEGSPRRSGRGVGASSVPTSKIATRAHISLAPFRFNNACDALSLVWTYRTARK